MSLHFDKANLIGKADLQCVQGGKYIANTNYAEDASSLLIIPWYLNQQYKHYKSQDKRSYPSSYRHSA